MRTHRRQALLLVLIMGIVALLAQVAGVGTKLAPPPSTKPSLRPIATIPGGAVPDIGSSKLASTRTSAAAGETVRMRATARLRVGKLKRGAVAQVVCGIRYSRDGDPSWTLGTPYETVVLKRVGATENVSIERSFAAPAKDTYRMSSACHVAAPTTGARVNGSGSMTVARGLPSGAATPVK